MGPISVHRRLRRLRHRLGGALLVLALVGVVALHHSEMAGGSVGTDHDHGAAMVMTMCLGAFVAVGAAIAAVAVGEVRLGRWSVVLHAAPRTPLLLRRVPVLPRAGPNGLPLLVVWRL